MGTPLAKAEDLATLLGRSAFDPSLLLALTRASDAFVGAVGFPVHQVVDDELLVEGSGGRRLELPARPVSAAKVTLEDGEEVASVTPGASPVLLDRRLGILYRQHGWPSGPVLVTYTHGYPDDKIPGDIADVVLERAAHIAETLGIYASETTGPFTDTLADGANGGVTERWSQVVARYQIGIGDRA